MQSLVRGIGGEFVLPAPGGDVVRDGAGVLPTGRNIHALDPYRIPSAAAMVRGRIAATLILEAHRKKGRSHLCYALFIISSLHISYDAPIKLMFMSREYSTSHILPVALYYSSKSVNLSSSSPSSYLSTSQLLFLASPSYLSTTVSCRCCT
jgi:CobN/Magnesium Chelatase